MTRFKRAIYRLFDRLTYGFRQVADCASVTSPVRQTVCHHCPFRKDRAPWMPARFRFINLCRIRLGFKQHCHGDMEHACLGMELCKRGGNETIMSPDELGEIQLPKTMAESSKAYWGEEEKQ